MTKQEFLNINGIELEEGVNYLFVFDENNNFVECFKDIDAVEDYLLEAFYNEHEVCSEVCYYINEKGLFRDLLGKYSIFEMKDLENWLLIGEKKWLTR